MSYIEMQHTTLLSELKNADVAEAAVILEHSHAHQDAFVRSIPWDGTCWQGKEPDVGIDGEGWTDFDGPQWALDILTEMDGKTGDKLREWIFERLW